MKLSKENLAMFAVVVIDLAILTIGFIFEK